jgi:hypothetical protein
VSEAVSKAISKEEKDRLIGEIIVKKQGRWKVDMCKCSKASELPELLTSTAKLLSCCLRNPKCLTGGSISASFSEKNNREKSDVNQARQEGRSRLIVESELPGGVLAGLMFF